MRHPILFLAPLAGLFGGCSLVGLDNYDAPVCADDSDCAAANEARGFALDGCMLYQCDRELRGCVLRLQRDDDDDDFPSAACATPSQIPDCDDNDPAAFPGAAITTSVLVSNVDLSGGGREWTRWSAQSGTLGVTYPAPTMNATGFQPLVLGAGEAVPTEVGFAVDAMPSMFNAVGLAEQCWAILATPQVPPMGTPVGIGPTTCQTHAECQDGDFCNGWETCDPGSPASDPPLGCRASERELCSAAGEACDAPSESCITVAANTGCRWGEIAVAPAGGDEWLAAAVNVNGCQHGQLRVGWISSGPADLVMGAPGARFTSRGDARRAPSFYAIDVDATSGSPCSGVGRAAGEPPGVSSLALSSLPADTSMRDRRRGQGLVAWLAAPRCRGAGGCSGTLPAGYTDANPVGVEVLGVFQEQTGGSPAIHWTTPLGNGIPIRFATRALGAAPPGLAAIGGDVRGYLVAYAAEGGGIVAHFVGASDDLPEVNQDQPPYPTTVSTTVDRTTAPLMEIGVEQMLPGGGGAAAVADGVVIAAAPAAAGSVDVLFAWQEDGSVWASTAELDRSTGMLSGWSPRRLSSGNAEQPGVTYGANLCGAGCAGWAVAWVEAGAVWMARLRLDGTDLDAAPQILAGTSASHPQPVALTGLPRVLFHEAGDNALVATSAYCPAP